MNISKGDIYMVNFGQSTGFEIEGIRPAVIIQNNIGNKYSPITYVAPVTSNIEKIHLVGKIIIPKEEGGLPVDSAIDINQIRAIDKSRLNKYIGRVPDNIINELSNFIQFIVDGENMVIENNINPVTKYESDNSCIELETNQILKEFYSTYKKDNSFLSKFVDNICSGIISYIITAIIFFLLGFLSK